MRPSARTIRRSIAASAAACAAALSVTAAVASSATAASSQVAPECKASALQVWIGLPADHAAGHAYYPMEFTNVSRRTCDLYGYPGVSAIHNNRQAGSAAVRDPAVPRRTVRLLPAATASATLVITNVAVFSPASCQPVTADELRIYPPDQRQADFLEFSFPACAKAGSKYLAIQAIHSGVGIPDHPFLVGK
jgi:hypothetical protein